MFVKIMRKKKIFAGKFTCKYINISWIRLIILDNKLYNLIFFLKTLGKMFLGIVCVDF